MMIAEDFQTISAASSVLYPALAPASVAAATAAVGGAASRRAMSSTYARNDDKDIVYLYWFSERPGALTANTCRRAAERMFSWPEMLSRLVQRLDGPHFVTSY